MHNQKHILLIGAGKSTTVLIEYLKNIVSKKKWHFTAADFNLEMLQSKLGESIFCSAVQLDIHDDEKRKALIVSADIVISMMPASLHYLVAIDCLEYGKHLLTASYTDKKIKELEPAIISKDLLFLCEMGLDPGIDHMSALQLIHRIQSENGKIKSFKSHCAGLVSPENDDNPWHYKISWNPRNVVTAGKDGAQYRLDGQNVQRNYHQIFTETERLNIPSLSELSYYPNRDSLAYIDLYKLHDIDTFMRTTLRYSSFIRGWNEMISLKLTDENHLYELKGLSIAAFFNKHFEFNKCHRTQNNELLDLLNYLGMNDSKTILPMDMGTAADVLQFLLENKLALKKGEKDMIVMMHEIEYERNDQLHKIQSSLICYGLDELRTAMAKTVGLPLAIAAVLILEGLINERGLKIPILPSIYEPVLKRLELEGIKFNETELSHF